MIHRSTLGHVLWAPIDTNGPRRYIQELRVKVLCALFSDSNRARDIIENSKINERIKYIDVAYYNTRENLLLEAFFLFRVVSIDNSTDLITKPLRKMLYDRHVRLLTNRL